jgi:dihydropyrimidinase
MESKIINGKIVTSESSFVADIGIDKGKITAIAPKIGREAKNVIDARGMLIFPGVIDAHVHFQLPVSGTVTSDDFESGTKAAACGGVTTVIDFAVQEKGETLKNAVGARRVQADGKVAIDYSLHAVPTDWNERTRRELPRLAANGITSFKMYMIYPGLQSDDSAIFSALEETAKFGGLITVHAESAGILDLFIKRYHNKRDMAKYGAYCHALSRPAFVETEAIGRAINWAKAIGGRLYIVHMSTGGGAEIINNAQKCGVKVYSETCPHYLLFDDSILNKNDGYLYATCPQVKSKKDSNRLWQGLANGDVSVVATDSCTFSKKQKAAWKGDFTKIPYGLPGVETLLPLMYSYGVGRKLINAQQLVRLLCANPAKLMGLYPQKGAIARGSDADLVIFDPKKKVTLSYKNLQTNCDWSPYEGFKVIGYPHITISRGKAVAIDGRFVGQVGWGRFVRRTLPMHL